MRRRKVIDVRTIEMAAHACDDPFFIQNCDSSDRSFARKENSFNNFKAFQDKRFGDSKNGNRSQRRGQFHSKFGKPSGVNPISNSNFSESIFSPKISEIGPSRRDLFFIKPIGKFNQKGIFAKEGTFDNKRLFFSNTKNTVGNPAVCTADKNNFSRPKGGSKHNFFYDNNECDETTTANAEFDNVSRDRTIFYKNTRKTTRLEENATTRTQSQQVPDEIDKTKRFPEKHGQTAKRQRTAGFFKLRGNQVKDRKNVFIGKDRSFKKVPHVLSKGPKRGAFRNRGMNNAESPERMTSFQKAMLDYQNQQELKEAEKKEQAKKRDERQDALARYKKKKREKSIKLSKKTKKGQPIMKERIEMLLERIQKTIAHEEKNC